MTLTNRDQGPRIALGRRGLLALAIAALVAGAAWLLNGFDGAHAPPTDAEYGDRPDAGASGALRKSPRRSPTARQQTSGTAPAKANTGDTSRARPEAIPSTAELAIQVLKREDGRPVAGATVDLERMQEFALEFPPPHYLPPDKQTLVTDDSGRVAFEVEPGEYEAWAQVGKGSRLHVSEAFAALAAGERREVVLDLPTLPTFHMFGRVVDARDDSPIGTATVEVRDSAYSEDEADSNSRGVALHHRCSAEGYFEVQAPAWDVWTIQATAPGFGPVNVAVSHGYETRERACVVRLKRAAALEVSLKTFGGEAAHPLDAMVAVRSYEVADLDADPYLSPRPVGGSVWHSAFDERGIATFEGLPAGAALDISLRRADTLVRQEGSQLRLLPGERRRIELVLGAGAVLHGLLADLEGQPISDAEVWLVPLRAASDLLLSRSATPAARVRTDCDGEFRFDDVPVGNWMVAPAPAGLFAARGDPEALAPLARGVTVRAGDLDWNLRLIAYRGLYIRGRVVGPDGTPVVAVGVAARGLADYVTCSGSSRADGSFVVGPLPAGPFTLSAEDSEGRYARSEPVDADAGQGDVVLRVGPGAGVRGSLVLPDGQACPGFLVLTGPDGIIRCKWTMPDGSFRFSGLEPGIHTIVAATRRDRICVQECELRAGAAEQRLRLTVRPGARVHIAYLGPDEAGPFQIRQRGVVIAADGIAAGASRTLTVLPGEMSIQLWSPGPDGERSTEPRTLEAMLGETREIAFGKAP